MSISRPIRALVVSALLGVLLTSETASARTLTTSGDRELVGAATVENAPVPAVAASQLSWASLDKSIASLAARPAPHLTFTPYLLFAGEKLGADWATMIPPQAQDRPSAAGRLAALLLSAALTFAAGLLSKPGRKWRREGSEGAANLQRLAGIRRPACAWAATRQ